MKRRRIAPLWMGWTVAIVGLLAIPGTAPALVSPVTIIQQQILKPNMLIVMDTSTSMMSAPGNTDMNSNEVGMDCDDGVDCRQVGQPGRCFFSSVGAMGAGVDQDYTSCTTDAQCRIGYCRYGAPGGCWGNNDCGGG